MERVRQSRIDLDHPRVIDVQNYRYIFALKFSYDMFCCFWDVVLIGFLLWFEGSIFVTTWNVAGKSPPSNLNLDDLLHAAPPADIYVLGYDSFSFLFILISFPSSAFGPLQIKHFLLLFSDFRK